MFNPVLEVLVLAAVALFVLSRLYSALGKDEDNRPMRPKTPTGVATERVATDRPDATPRDVRPNERPIFVGPAAAGLEDIYNADNSFTESGFMQGAKQAYQMLVNAYAKGDRATLRPLLDDDVWQAWDAAITAREGKGEPVFELLRIKKAEIENAWMDGNWARISVRYEAQLGDGETTRTAREIWTFMHDTGSDNPNWLLDDVEEAK